MKILFTVNLNKPDAKAITEQAVKILREHGAVCLLDSKNQSAFDWPSCDCVNFSQLCGDFDMIVTVGGDGTIMNAAKYSVFYDKPLLGINAGRLGFLAGLENTDLDKLPLLLEWNYVEHPRMMLKVIHVFKNGELHYTALNDAVLAKAALSSVIDVQVQYGQRGKMDYRCDSIIFSTPTGSTAYALSNGGPIADPDLSFIALAPICPHSLVSRTLLFSERSVIQVQLGEDNRTDAFLLIDGKNVGQVMPDDHILIQQCENRLRLISLDHREFYEVVSKKFFH